MRPRGRSAFGGGRRARPRPGATLPSAAAAPTAVGRILRPHDRDACRSLEALRDLGRRGGAERAGAARSDLHAVRSDPAEDHLGALAPRGLQPEVDDRSPLDDRVVADDEADLRVPDRGERCPEPVEHRIEVVGDQRHRGGAEALPDEACERGRVLDGLAAGEGDDDGARRLAKPPLSFVERLLDRAPGRSRAGGP